MNNNRTVIRRILHEMLDEVMTQFNARVVTVIQRQEAWIQHITNSLSCASTMVVYEEK